MRAPVGKSAFVIFLILLCSFCNIFFDKDKAKELFSHDRKIVDHALSYCIEHRTQTEDYLLARYPSESGTNQGRILWLLRLVGGEKSAVFMCKLIAATPPTDEENVSIRINILGFILSDYDWGSFYLHPDRTDYSRTVIVSRKNKQFFADTIAALYAQL